MLRIAVPLAAIATLVVAASDARAQVCTQVAPSTAQIQVTTATTAIKVISGVPKANTVSCGFVASDIHVIGRAANDTIKLDYVPPPVPVTVTSGGGADVLVVYGNGADDTIACGALGLDRDGNGADDVVFDGLPAKITLYGQAGDDVLDCSNSPVKVTLYGGVGDDALAGSAFADTLDAGDGHDAISGGAGNDSITGGLGNDYLIGDAGNDTFVSTPAAVGATDGADGISGGAGTDVVSYAKRAYGVVAGAGGEDSIGNDVETIKGGAGPDRFDFSIYPTPHNLYGAAGNDVLVGGSAADKLYGEAGNDRLRGGAGKDVLDGGDGNDVFAPTQDGQAETLKCGNGRDWYIAATEDPRTACEHAYETQHRIATGDSSSCAVLSDGRVKCWGNNAYGQLGLGDAVSRGGNSWEMGANLPSVDLGTRGTPATPNMAVSITAGAGHACALLDDGNVKCWGEGTFGALGLGDAALHGDQPGEMGNALPTVALGTGRTAIAISAGAYSSCALLDNGQVKCWGSNSSGQLGLGDDVMRGTYPGQMGDALPAVDLGTGRTATAIAQYGYHACAILDDGNVKCWGYDGAGQLGLGSTGARGDGPNEMGNFLPAVDLGTGRIAVRLADGNGTSHTCAVLDDGSLKCWGYNFYGQLGLGDTSMRGDSPGEMGDALPAVDLGAGRTALAIAISAWDTCAILDDRSVKCWGWGTAYLGLGASGNDLGDQPGEMGDALPAVQLGTGRSAYSIAKGYFHECAVLDAGLKCWGANNDGRLGLGDTNDRGDTLAEMGDALPSVDLAGTVPYVATNDDDELDPWAVSEDDLVDDGEGGCRASRGSSGAVLALALLVVVRRRRSERA